MKFKIVPDEATCKTCQDEYGPGNTPCLGCCNDVYEVIKLENDTAFISTDCFLRFYLFIK